MNGPVTGPLIHTLNHFHLFMIAHWTWVLYACEMVIKQVHETLVKLGMGLVVIRPSIVNKTWV